MLLSQDTIHGNFTRKTPEQGTKLSFFSRAILNRVNEGMKTNPDSLFLRYDKLTTIRKKPAHIVVDTVLHENNIPVRIFVPRQAKSNDELPVVIFYHGGAFIFGSIETYSNLAGKICRKSKCIVVLPEYRLAPQYPYPAATLDCYNTLKWVVSNIHNFGGSKNKITLMGDSAGGNLSMVTSLMNQDKEKAKILCQILFYPNTLLTDTILPSRDFFTGRYGKSYLLSESLMYKVKVQYLNGVSDTLPYVSPALAKLTSNLPPSLIITAQCDPLRDEGVLLFKNLQNVGVQANHTQYKGMIHGFISFYKISRIGRKAIREGIRFMRVHLES